MGADDGQSLETGYLASTPTRDNALFDYARGEADSFAALARSSGGRVHRDAAIGISLADSGVQTPFGNTAHLTKPMPDGALPTVLRPSAVSLPPSNPKLRISPVETADQLADFEQTLVEAYPAPEMQPWRRGAFFRPELLDTSWRLFAGYEGARCVATAAAWVSSTHTIVEMVSVRTECRGKGYGAAITAAATAAEPDRAAMLIASDLGRPVYDQLGYLPLLRYTLFVGMRRSGETG